MEKDSELNVLHHDAPAPFTCSCFPNIWVPLAASKTRSVRFIIFCAEFKMVWLSHSAAPFGLEVHQQHRAEDIRADQAGHGQCERSGGSLVDMSWISVAVPR